MPQRDRLNRLRAELADLADVDFNLSYRGSTGCIVKRDRKTDEITVLAEFVDASSDEQTLLIGVLENMRFLLGLVDSGKVVKRPDYAAEAAMRCNEPRFWTFLGSLESTEAQPRNEKEAGKALCAALGINSRARLNDDPEAAVRWKHLRARFQAWGLV